MDPIPYAISQKKFDIFITDYRLPGMNGIDITRMLRLACPGVTVGIM
jgi:CheY-like chemotaxis protein